MKIKNHIDVCYSPALVHLYDVKRQVVVVIDVLRATSSMCVGFSFGIEKMYPVMTVEECERYKRKGLITAAERHGEKVPGFDLGNSPFGFMNEEFSGRSLAITTTNGTIAIHAVKDAKQVAVGAFTNISALCEWLSRQDSDVLLLCAGWKNRFNLEDTLFAGAVIQKLRPFFEVESDSAIAAEALYEEAEGRILRFLKNSSHARRLAHLNIQRDVEFCLLHDLTHVVPVVSGDFLHDLNKGEVKKKAVQIRRKIIQSTLALPAV